MEQIKELEIYGGKHTLQFIEDKDVWPEKHEYRVDRELVDLTVSGITKVLDKPALVGWATKMCAEFVQLFSGRLSAKVVVSTLTGLAVDEVELEAFIADMKAHGKGKKKEAATIGTMAHKYVEEHIKNVLGLGPKPKMPVNASVQKAVGAFLEWEKAHKVVYLASERLVYSRTYKYAGQVDIEATVDGELSILDCKTSSGFYDEMDYQVAGYQIAAEEEALFVKRPVQYAARWILRLDKLTGEFEVKKLTDHAGDKACFLACLTIARRKLAQKKANAERKKVQKEVRDKNKEAAAKPKRKAKKRKK